ncbi:RNA-directed DNA polymerase, eukaryota, reverse transcriptase zinc-binding domain protein [Tanacetum coccineum]
MIVPKSLLKEVYWIRIRELEPWSPELDDEFCESSSDDESVGEEKNNSITRMRLIHVAGSSFMNENIENVINEQEPPQDKISEDPFGIYNILNKQDNKEAGQDSDPSHPPGFTQEEEFYVCGDPNSFVKDNATISDYFVAVRGTWLSTATKVMFVSIYAPQDISEKKSLWEYITHIIDTWDGECIILGDFNEVRSKQERFGTIFNETAANAFNHFISTAGLIDLPLEGYSFTWAIKSAKKMSKLDRFLISEGLLLKFPSLSAICLDRHLSDHRPIIMREVVTDYGHHLFKKLQALKASIKEWCKDDIKRSNDTCFSIKARLSDLDKIFDNGLLKQRGVTGHRSKDGDWIDEPCKVFKNEFSHALCQLEFERSSGPCIDIVLSLVQKVSSEQVWMSPSGEGLGWIIALKVSNRLSKWKIKTLSVGGRLTLIKSVLTSLPLYHMSLYKAPLGVLRDLESLRRKFFNGADINEKRFSMISWNKILASKQKGGLGVSSFFALNRSLLFKWVWRFLSQDASLWHRLIAVLYGNRSPFVHTGSVSSLSPWNCILKELNSLSAKGINLLALLKKKVGNGANTLFWEDCWINDVPLSRSFPRLYALELKKGITVADKLIDASFVASFRRNPRGGVEEEQLHHLVELVGSISLSPSNDRWAWLLGSSGEFSVHSARTFIDDILLPFVGDVTRWVKVVPIKVNILAWKVCLDKLPTRLNLSLRGIDIPSIICPNCGLAGESCSHLFYSCNLARTLWRKIARWWEIDIPDFSCYEEWIAWFKTTRFSKAQKEMLEGVFYVMWWMIWKFRNQVLFGSSHPRMELLFDDILLASFFINFNLPLKKKSLTQPQQVDSQKKGGRKKTKAIRGKNVEDEPQELVVVGHWLPVEEELLATCYVAISEDNNVGRSQKHETFWYQVLNEFNSNFFQKRTKDMLTSKWHTLNANCQKFNAAYKRAKRLGKSGENDVDYLKRAQSIYRDEHKGVAFSQEDAWAVLIFHPKWDAPEQVDLTGDVPGATQEDLFGHDARPRSAGKQRPAKKTKSDATEGTGGSRASTQFGELMEQELRLKREAAERAFEAQAEKDRKLMRLEELRFLATITKDLDDDDAYWIKKQKKLIKNKMRNDLGEDEDE